MDKLTTAAHAAGFVMIPTGEFDHQRAIERPALPAPAGWKSAVPAVEAAPKAGMRDWLATWSRKATA